MRPCVIYRGRPKKTGAKKRQRVLSQKRRLLAFGYDKEKIDKMNVVEIRDLLKREGKKKQVKAKAKVKATKPKTKKSKSK